MRRGFTLVELMIALGLMAVLVTAIAQVFSGAQRIFTETDAKVVLYQNVRVMFDQIERDLNNTEKTYAMEFFNDVSPANGIYDGGAEQIAELGDYDYGPVFEQATYEDEAGGKHRADVMYFRSIAEFRGETRPVLIRYELRYRDLAGTTLRLPVLERKLRYVESNEGGQAELNADWEIGGRYNYVTDFQVQLYYTNRRTQETGQFYSPRTLASNSETKHKLYQYGSSEDKVRCVYEGTNDGKIILVADNTYGGATWHYLASNTNNQFGLVGAMDKFLIKFDDPNSGQLVKKVMTVQSIWQLTSQLWAITFYESFELQQNQNNIPCDYLAAWLPPAVKITCRVIDSSAQPLGDGNYKGSRIVSRVFRLLRAT